MCSPSRQIAPVRPDPSVAHQPTGEEKNLPHRIPVQARAHRQPVPTAVLGHQQRIRRVLHYRGRAVSITRVNRQRNDPVMMESRVRCVETRAAIIARQNAVLFRSEQDLGFAVAIARQNNHRIDHPSPR